MATKDAKVRLSGRFPVGERVRLHKASGPDQARPEGTPIAVKKVQGDQTVEFTGRDVVEGGYYLLSGYVDGQPRVVRARGKVDGDNDPLFQPPVVPDAQTFRTQGQADKPSVRVDPEHRAQLEAAAEADEVEVLKGEALDARAAELDIAGRTSMTADEKRAAIAEAEAAAEDHGPADPDEQ